MKLRYKFILYSGLSVLLINVSCNRQSDGHHHTDTELHDEHHHDNDHKGQDGEILISPARANELGIKVTQITPGNYAAAIEVAGELIPSPSSLATVSARSSGLITFSKGVSEGMYVNQGATLATISARGMQGGDMNEANRIALDAAKRELDRLTPLAEDGIVTRRDYNAAKQRYDEALAAVAGGGGKAGSTIIAPMSGTLVSISATDGQYVETGQSIGTIAGNTNLLLRVDLPERYSGYAKDISGATFKTTYNDDIHDILKYNGVRVTSQLPASTRGGYVPLYFSLQNDGTLIPGSFCTIYLKGKETADVITVPKNAVTEQQGIKFVYVKTDDAEYHKQPVVTGTNDGYNVEILSGINPGDLVVTEGTIFVRLAETSSVVPEGHKHNH